MSEHSTVCGGSSAGRYVNCIGSTDLAKRAPPKPDGNEYTRLGTALHYVVEEILGAEEEIDPLTLVGDVIELDEFDENGNPYTVELTETHILTKIIPALDWFDNVLDPDEYWLEQKVEFTGELAGAFGTADVMFVKGDRAGIVDWKFGDGVMVSAEDNDQMRFYLAAAAQASWWDDLTKHVKTFDAYIVQPVDGVNEIESHAQYSWAELTVFLNNLLEAKRKKDAGDKTLTCGKWCKFCPAEMICPEWRDRGKNAIETLKQVEVKPEFFKSGKKKGEPKAIPPKKQTAATLDTFTPEDLASFYLDAVEISTWAEQVKKYVKDCLERGDNIQGLKRVVFQNERQWIDEQKAQNWVRRQGLKATDYQEPARLKSPAKIEKLLGKDRVKTELVRNTPKGYQVVSLDDPRPAVGSSAPDDNSLSNQLAQSLGKN